MPRGKGRVVLASPDGAVPFVARVSAMSLDKSDTNMETEKDGFRFWTARDSAHRAAAPQSGVGRRHEPAAGRKPGHRSPARWARRSAWRADVDDRASAHAGRPAQAAYGAAWRRRAADGSHGGRAVAARPDARRRPPSDAHDGVRLGGSGGSGWRWPAPHCAAHAAAAARCAGSVSCEENAAERAAASAAWSAH